MKQKIDELAVFGAEPAFSEKIHVGRPNIGDKEIFINRVKDIIDRKWLTNDGHYVKEFERKISELCGVEHCIAMCNGTLSLENTIRAAGLRGEVIVPSFTFIGTANALQWQEITPVFCDIDPRTYTIDPAAIEKMITPKTTGIIGVHLWGRICDVEALQQVADRNGLTLIFDAAHAFGCTYRDKYAGNFGRAEVFSFHATKFINTLEGGAVVTNDDELAKKIRLMKNFGFTGYDSVEYLGVNGKMNEISAAMGLTSLESLSAFIDVNRKNYLQYRTELSGLPGVSIISYDADEKSNYQYVILEINEKITRISRDRFVGALHAENVLARRYFYPGCHRMEPYKSLFPHAGLLLPETERISERVVALPTGTSMNAEKIKTICNLIKLIIKHGPDVACAYQN